MCNYYIITSDDYKKYEKILEIDPIRKTLELFLKEEYDRLIFKRFNSGNGEIHYAHPLLSKFPIEKLEQIANDFNQHYIAKHVITSAVNLLSLRDSL